MTRRTTSGVGAFAGLAALGAEKIVSLGVALYVSRHLSLADYGYYGFILAYLNVFQVVPDGALETVLVTQLARRADAAPLAGKGAALRLALSLTMAVVALAVLRFVRGAEDLAAPAAMWAGGLVAAAASPYRALLRGTLQMGRYFVLLAAQGAVGLALLIAVVQSGGGLLAVLGAAAGASVAGLVAGRALAGSGARLEADPAVARMLLGGAWPVAASALVLLGAQQVLQLTLLAGQGPSELGLLGGAQKVVEAVGLLPQAAMVTLLPALASRMPDAGTVVRTGATACRLLTAVVLGIVLVLLLWGGSLLGFAFRPAFAAGAPALRWLAAGLVLTVSGAVITGLLVTHGLQRVLLSVNAVGAVGTLVLGAVLVPRHGAAGVAMALTGGSGLGQTLLCLLPATRAIVRPVFMASARPLLAAVFAGGLGVEADLGPAAVVLTYLTVLVATGGVRRTDLEFTRTLAPPGRGPETLGTQRM